MSFDGVLIRSRASVTPSAMRVRSSPSTPAGQHQPHIARIGLAVAAELIGAERKSQGGEPRVVWRIGEAVAAGWQQGHKLPRAEQILHRFVGRLDAEQHAGEGAVARRNDKMASGLGLEGAGAHERVLARIEDFSRFGEIARVDEQDGHSRRLTGACENRMHGHSAASRKEGVVVGSRA